MTKMLVTGADGFIGSHLVERLVREGRSVRAFVAYNSFGTWGWLDHVNPDTREAIDVFMGDIRDESAVREAMLGCDAALHLAALIGIPYSYLAPMSYVETNIGGTLNVLQAAKELGVGKVIRTSTSEVYGTPQTVPITEEHPLQGQSPYAATKIGADHLALSFYLSFGTPVTVVRPFNTFGPRQSVRAVIPTIIAQIARGAREIELGALHPKRDFNYVADTVSGFTAALDSENTSGEVINIGSGFEFSIGETLSEIANIMGVEVTVSERAERLRPANSEVDRLLADNSKAMRLLNWAPEISGREGFQRGLEKTIEWFAEPAHLDAVDRQRYTV